MSSDATSGAPSATARWQMNPRVFFASVTLIALLLVPAAVFSDSVGAWFSQLQALIVARFGWFYVFSMTGFVGFAVWLAFSRYGHVRLGPDDSKPDFGLLTWFSMLFSAGMGIGLLFFSVAEPMMHYASPPSGEGNTLESARQAMGLTFFHWGLHPWAVYSVVGLALAYFGFRQKLPFSIRSAFYPLVGDRIHGPVGDAIDTLAVVSTLFGVATSLGLGAMQVNAGLGYTLGVEQGTGAQVVIIVLITVLATASVVSGLDVGIRRLSELNMGLAASLLAFVALAGPTTFLLGGFVQNLGTYLQLLPFHAFWTAAFDQPAQQQWLSSWTVFYWAWWIAWTPFVGMFIARISRGRTIREFMLAVLLGPTLVGFVWLTVFGNGALHQELFGGGSIASTVSESVPTAVFVLLETYPLAGLTSVLCTLCIVLFFVTSSDSASLVIDHIASGGRHHPPVAQRIFWAVLEGAVASVLLVAGGLKALQTAALTTALPFCALCVGMCVALVRGLRAEGKDHD